MGGQTYNFQIFSVLGDVLNWDSPVSLSSSSHYDPICCSPPARWGLLDFIRAVLLLRLLTRCLLLAVQIPVGTAGPPPRAPDPSVHCRTSTASCRSQWALPDLNRDFQVAVGTAGPQREEKMSDRMSEDMPDKMSDRMPEDMPDRMPEDLPDRMPEDMPEHMPEDMPDRMPEDMSDRMPEDLPVRKCINVMVRIIRSEVICLTLPALVWQWFSRTANSYRTDWWSNKNHVYRIGSRQLCKLHSLMADTEQKPRCFTGSSESQWTT